MSWEDLSAPPTTPVDPVPTSPVAVGGGGFSLRRGIATALLAASLVAIGGVAVVNAADPSASPTPSQASTPDGSTAPSQTGGSTAPGAPGTGPGHHGAKGDCPNMGGTGGSGTAPTTPTTPTPSTTPSSSPDV